MKDIAYAVQLISEKSEKQQFRYLNDCISILDFWRNTISLNAREQILFESEILSLNQHISRLEQNHFRIAVLGRTGVGKSSLLNALSGTSMFTTSIRNGSTQQNKSFYLGPGNVPFGSVELIDTPGIDELNHDYSKHIGVRIAQKVELILFVINSDLTTIDLQLLQVFVQSRKPTILILNCIDRYSLQQQTNLIRSIKRRLPSTEDRIPIIPVSASPRQAYLSHRNHIRSFQEKPRIGNLQRILNLWFIKIGKVLLVVSALQSAYQLNNLLCRWRLQQEQARTFTVTGTYTIFKTIGVVLTHKLYLNLFIVFMMDMCLTFHLMRTYKQQISQDQLKKFFYKISLHSAFFGGVLFSMKILLRFLEEIHISIESGVLTSLHLEIVFFMSIQVALAIYTSRSIEQLVKLHLLHSDTILSLYMKKDRLKKRRLDFVFSF